jgi:Spy/CpxP family protein refolding chaperone
VRLSSKKLANLTEKKMNKRTLLVLTCALFLALAGLQGFAQSSADPAASQAASNASQAAGDPNQAAVDPETRAKVQAKLQELSSELNLTDDQKTQLKGIVQDEVQQIKAVRDDSSLSPDQKKAKVTEIRQSHKSQMSSILTPEQQKKLETIKETNPK